MSRNHYEKIAHNLYCVEITLPNNPLKCLNSYIFTGQRNLLIDTGFNIESCLKELLDGISSLNIYPQNTDVFLSHAHADHTGNAKALQDFGFHVIMGKEDYDVLNTDAWPERKERALKEGMPRTILEEVFSRNPAVKFVSEPFDANFVFPGDTLFYGDFALEVIHTPGHTPGQMCLLDENTGIFYSSDHVLFDITPNINSRGIGTDALGTYLDSLSMIRDIDASLVLPGHRTTSGKSLDFRVDELICHHERRLDEILSVIKEYSGINAYDIAGHIRWKIQAKSWADFPASQKWFAVSETLSHLDYLEKRHVVKRVEFENGYGYSL